MADTAQIPVRPREDVDPEGDLVLLVGPDEVGIRVNSKVLSRASPVFAAMLGPRFAEGRALQYLAPAEFSSIPLPEDDVDAMIRLCRAFHFKLSINEELVTFDFCLKLASLCDKYDASIALGSWSEVWMKPFRDSFNGDTSYFGGLYIARSFNNHRVFWLITRNIMCNLSAESVKLPDSFPKDMLPDRLVDAINAARGSVLRQLQDTIEGIIAPYLEMPCPLSIYHRQKQEKCGILTLGGHYFQELARLGFWPSSKLLYQSSPAHIAEELPKYESYDPKDERDREYYSINYDCTKTYLHLNCKEQLKAAATKAFIDQEGLCLRCVNEGKVTVEEGNCRAAEEYECATLAMHRR